MFAQIFFDALFAAIAAIGFSAISNPPARTFAYSAVIAAIGHSMRFWLMNCDFGPGMNIVPATFAAAFAIGVLAVLLSPKAEAPAETCFFPALLPMIPGIYAYRTFGGFAMCVMADSQELFSYYFYQFAYNGFNCLCILVSMAIGVTLPVFMLEKISFQATRLPKFS